jgi:hypothetical protein
MSTINEPYLAYLHCRPDGSPFYVGKGSTTRMKQMSGRNKHHTNVVNKHGKANILKGFLPCSTSDIALELEKGIIKCLARMGVNLTNKTLGGEGSNGYSHKAKAKEAMSIFRTGKSYVDLYGEERAAEIKEQKVEAMSGDNNPNYGKPLNTTHRNRISSSKKGQVWYNNGEVSRMFINGTEPEGFIKGRGKVLWQQ